MVPLTVLFVVGSTEAKSLMVDKKFSGAPLVAGFGLGVFLYIIGLANSKLEELFCIFVIVTALLVNGNDLFKAVAEQPKTKNPIVFV